MTNKEIFGADLPGYNHKFGKLEASFEFASKSRPKPNRARILDYCSKGNSLYNNKIQELMRLGVLEKSSNLEIQPAFKNNSFLVKKQAAGRKPWQDCTLKDVCLVTSFAQLQDYIKTIPAKIN